MTKPQDTHTPTITEVFAAAEFKVESIKNMGNSELAGCIEIDIEVDMNGFVTTIEANHNVVTGETENYCDSEYIKESFKRAGLTLTDLNQWVSDNASQIN